MSNTKGAYKTTFLNRLLREQLQAYLAAHPEDRYSRLVQRLLTAFFAYQPPPGA